jgi:phospholipase C
MLSRKRAALLVPVATLLVLVLLTSLAAMACGTSGDLASGSPGDASADRNVVPPGHDASDDATDAANDDVYASEDAGADWLAPPAIARDAGEATLAPLRSSCMFEAGAWPAETIGAEYPLGHDIPINHIIVIMQENRSFDHYLGRLVAQGYYKPGDFTVVGDGGSDAGDAGDASTTSDASDDAAAAVDSGLGAPGSGFLHSDELDGPPPGWSNPDGDGGIIVPHPDDEYCFGVNHSWGAQHDDYDNGRNDHFVTQNDPDGERTFFYEDDTVIPFYYALANDFAVGDRYFCSVLSSTWPNRYFLMAATSFGIGDNSFCQLDTSEHPVPQIFSLLEAGGHSWMDYTDGSHMEEFFPYFGLADADTRAHYGNVECDMLGAIASGTLPDVSFMMGDEESPQDSDEGPSDLPGIGGQLTETILRTLFASPSWKDTAVFITYDENGGIADHVPPAPACAPDGYTPHDVNDALLAPGTFDQTGFRVPFIVISPYARQHFVSHVVHDHTSITRFIEARFGLPALTGRDANSTPPMEMFDFQNPPWVTPPNITATTPVPSAILSQCKQTLAPLACTTK